LFLGVAKTAAKAEAAKKVAKLIVETLAHSTDEGKLDEIRQSVQELTKQFPLYE